MPPDEPEPVGWFVGWVEHGSRRVYFATALDGGDASGLNARRITERVLGRIGVLPS